MLGMACLVDFDIGDGDETMILAKGTYVLVVALGWLPRLSTVDTCDLVPANRARNEALDGPVESSI